MKKPIIFLVVISLVLAAFLSISLNAGAAEELPMLNVKCQLSTNATATSETTGVRLIASVDALDKYSAVGWVFSLNDSTPTKDEVNTSFRESSVVYNSILANSIKKTAADIYNNASYAKYLFVYQITNIPNANFGDNIYVRSYVVLNDGTVKYGAVTTINIRQIINDSASSNKPSSTVSIKYNSDNSGWSSRWF